jgi:hypothetical protein
MGDPCGEGSVPGGLLVAVLMTLGCAVPNPAYHRSVGTKDAGPDRPGAPDAGPDRPAAAPDTAPLADLVPVGTLLGAWAMERTGDGTTVADTSGNGLTGTLVDMDPVRSWVPGRKGGTALEFAPTTAVPHPSVRLPIVPALEGLQRFTVAAWVYRTATSAPTQMSVISQQMNDTLYEVFNLSFNSDNLTFYLPGMPAGSGGQPYTVRAEEATPLGVWTHVAASYDGTKARLYRDGSLVKTLAYAGPLPLSSKPIFIGTNVNTGNEQPFVGYIDDVFLYNVALDDQAVAQLARP